MALEPTGYIIYRHERKTLVCPPRRVRLMDAFNEARQLVRDGKMHPTRCPNYDRPEREIEQFGEMIVRQNPPQLPCEACGKAMIGRVVYGHHTGNVKACNAKCQGATGPNCDCPCRGENHGGKHGG